MRFQREGIFFSGDHPPLKFSAKMEGKLRHVASSLACSLSCNEQVIVSSADFMEHCALGSSG